MRTETNTLSFEYSRQDAQARQIGRILCNDCGLHVSEHVPGSVCSGINHELASYLLLVTESPAMVA